MPEPRNGIIGRFRTLLFGQYRPKWQTRHPGSKKVNQKHKSRRKRKQNRE